MHKFLLIITLLCCGYSVTAKEIVVVAETVTFIHNGSYSHYDDGSYDSAHISKFKIITPVEHQNNELVFFHWVKNENLDNQISKSEKVEFRLEESQFNKMVNPSGSAQIGFSFISKSFKVLE